MPRKAPDRVEEVRITLGNYERAQLEQLVDSYQKDKILENIPSMLTGVAALGYVTVSGIAAYAVYKFLTGNSIGDLTSGAKDFYAWSVSGVGDIIGVATPVYSAQSGRGFVSNQDLQPNADGTPPDYKALEEEVYIKYGNLLNALNTRLETLEAKQSNPLTFSFVREVQIKTIKDQIKGATAARGIELQRIDEARAAYYAEIGRSPSRRDYYNPNGRGDTGGSTNDNTLGITSGNTGGALTSGASGSRSS